MGDVGDVAEYALRRDKVAASASMVEGKVRAQLRVVEGLSRVVKMIEIVWLVVVGGGVQGMDGERKGGEGRMGEWGIEVE